MNFEKEYAKIPGTEPNIKICVKCSRHRTDKPFNGGQFHYCTHYFGKEDDCMSAIGLTIHGKVVQPSAYRIPKDCDFQLEQLMYAQKRKDLVKK